MNEYGKLIKKIRFRRTIAVVLSVVAVLAVFAVCTPFYIHIGTIQIDYAGTSLAIAIPLLIVILIVYILAIAIVSMPIYSSMTVECDPKKYLALNEALSKAKMMPVVCAVAYIHLGEFARAAGYASQMIATGKPDFVIPGLFNKARCEFLLGDTENLKITAAGLGNAVDNRKTNAKKAEMYRHMRVLTELMCAISDGNDARINEYRSAVRPWNRDKSTECFVNYIKGIAAHRVGDMDECIYRLMWVRDNCPKTVFAWLADECLGNMKEQNQ